MSEEGSTEKAKLKWWQHVLQILWDHDMFTKSAAERALVFKLDVAILTSVCFGWWLKYIDQANLSNAYVSGMKEDLNIQANEYTYMGTAYNVALTIMTLFSNIIILKVRPSIFLPVCEIGWGVFTFAQAGATSSTQMYAFRALLGYFEASFSSVTIFLLGSWYTKEEMAKRMSVWFITAPAGSAFSGFLQAAIFSGLEGVHGIRGWRWLYIVCGCMTVPAGVILFFTLPDFPSNTRAWFINGEERQLAMTRCARNGMVPITGKINLATAKHLFSHWRFWVIVPIYIIYASSIQDYNYFAIWLSHNGYSVADRNVLSAAMFCIGIPFQILYGYMSDRSGNRWMWLSGPTVLASIPLGILAIYPANKTMKLCSFLLANIGFVTHIFYTITNEICKDNAEERALVISTMNALFYATNSWLPILIFPQTDAPDFRKGFPTSWALTLLSIPLFYFLHFMHQRQLRNQVVDNSSDDVTATPQRNQASKTRSYIPWKYETRMRDMVVRDIDDDVRRVRVGYIRA